MAMSIAGIDIADSIINTEFRVLVLEKIIERLLRAAPPGVLSNADIDSIRNEALESMQKKYPDAGIKKL